MWSGPTTAVAAVARSGGSHGQSRRRPAARSTSNREAGDQPLELHTHAVRTYPLPAHTTPSLSATSSASTLGWVHPYHVVQEHRNTHQFSKTLE